MIPTAALILFALVLPPVLGFHPYYLYLIGTAFLWASVASAWNLLETAGQISFGHAAFFGAGAYASSLLALQTNLSPQLGLPLGALVGGMTAVPLGLASHCLRSASLALATLAYAEALRVIARNWDALTGGGAGLIGIPPVDSAGGRAQGYYLSLLLLVTALAAVRAVERSRLGLAFAAIREREDRAQALGLAPTPVKLVAFVLSGGLTGLGGALYAHTVGSIQPDLVFGPSFSLLPLIMATFGGIRAPLGPTLGALVLYLTSQLVLHPLLPRLHQLPYALALIAVALALPRGLVGLFMTRRRTA